MALGPLPNVQNVARVKLNGTNQGTGWVALFFWHYLGAPPTGSDLVGLCIGFTDAYRTNMTPAFVDEVSVSNAEAWDLASREGAQASGGGSAPGTRIGSPLPVNIAAVCGWKVNYRWKGGHPRTYWPAGSLTDVESGHLWTDSARNAFELACSNFLGAVNALVMGGQGGYLTAVRYVHTPVPGGPAEYFNPPLDLRIQSAVVDKRLDSQRRRLGPDL